MTKISSIRPVLLSAPYAAKATNAEVQLHLPSGYRTCGLVEITLENGIKGLGEGYLAVFAPHVFTEIVNLLTPYLKGRELSDFDTLLSNIITATGYWSLQGAARHVLSAIEIALMDCRGQIEGVPVYQLLGGKNKPLPVYGSGGDSLTPEAMTGELEYLTGLGIKYFKIRARANQVDKAAWTIQKAKDYGIEIAIDMTQNLSYPGQTVQEVLDFESMLIAKAGQKPFFLEEPLGMSYISRFPELSNKAKSKIAGGEIVTTEHELMERVKDRYYHIAQPDATVIGGIGPVMKVFKAGAKNNTDTVVHCWGGPVGMLANYHAALAGDAELVEWPMPKYPMRDELLLYPWEIREGILHLSDAPGLGVKLTQELEDKYPFKEEAVYNCLPFNAIEYKSETWK